MKYLLLLLFIPFTSVANDEKKSELFFTNEDFSRLFTKTESRRFLDQEKRDITIPAKVNLEDKQAISDHKSAMVKVKGFILSDTGKQKIWLSDDDTLSETALALAKTSKNLGSSNRVAIQSGSVVKLVKPGQTWLVGQEKVTETYLLPQEPNSGLAEFNKRLGLPPLVDNLNNNKQTKAPTLKVLDKVSTSQKLLEHSVQQLEASN